MQNLDRQGYSRKVRLYGQPNSAEAYEIRDFLNRSVVEFDWVELTCDDDCQRELGLPSLSNIRLPVIQLPDGTQMFAPTVREIAHRLGWGAELFELTKVTTKGNLLLNAQVLVA